MAKVRRFWISLLMSTGVQRVAAHRQSATTTRIENPEVTGVIKSG